MLVNLGSKPLLCYHNGKKSNHQKSGTTRVRNRCCNTLQKTATTPSDSCKNISWDKTPVDVYQRVKKSRKVFWTRYIIKIHKMSLSFYFNDCLIHRLCASDNCGLQRSRALPLYYSVFQTRNTLLATLYLQQLTRNTFKKRYRTISSNIY